MKALPFFYLFLAHYLASSFASDAPSLEEDCEEDTANGDRNGEECYSVDSVVCETALLGDDLECARQLEGTYEYYLSTAEGGHPRTTIYTVTVTALVDCVVPNSPCAVTANDFTGNTVYSNVCVATDDGTVFVDHSEKDNGLYIFEEQLQGLVVGESYLKLRNDPDYCQYLAESGAPSFAYSWGPSSAPGSMLPSYTSGPESSMPSIEDTSGSMSPSLTAISDAPSYDPLDDCEEDLALGARNEDECYSVDTLICESNLPQPDDCTRELQGTYEYYLTTDEGGYPRLEIYTIVVTAQLGCTIPNAPCIITVTDQLGTTLYTNTCVATDDGTAFVNHAGVDDELNIFDEQLQGMVVGESYLKLRNDPDYCTYLGYSEAPSCSTNSDAPSVPASEGPTILFSDGPSISPGSYGPSIVPSFIPSVTLSDCYIDYNILGCYHANNFSAYDCGDCYKVDVTMCGTFYDTGCTEYISTFSYKNYDNVFVSPNVTITTSSGCSSNFGNFCQISIGNRNCDDCVLQVGTGPLHTVTMLGSCSDSDKLGDWVLPENQTIPLSEGLGYIQLDPARVTCGGPSDSPSVSLPDSSLPTIILSNPECYVAYNIPGCFNATTSSAYYCDNCYEVDVTLCDTVYNTGCVEYIGTYSYKNYNNMNVSPNITITTSVGCSDDMDDYCQISMGHWQCDDCIVETGSSPLSQTITMLGSCSASDKLGAWVLPENQTINLSEGVEYIQLNPDQVLCPPTASPTSSSGPTATTPPASLVPSYVETQLSGSEYPSGGYFSCYDAWADGVPLDGDCYAVDIGICYEEYPGGCVVTQAFYEYYNMNPSGQRDQYGYVSISASVNCDEEDRCSVSTPGGSCGGCAVVGYTVSLEDCSGFLQGPSQTLALAEGGGYPKIVLLEGCPSPAPTSDTETASRSGETDDLDVVRDGDKLEITLKPRFTLSFFDGHEDDIPPESSAVLILLERTQEFLRDVLSGHFAEQLHSIEADNIEQQYRTKPEQQFELSFEARISLDAATELPMKSRSLAQMLTDRHNLRVYVRDYARFADSNKDVPNGLFYYTEVVRARVTGSAAADNDSAA